MFTQRKVAYLTLIICFVVGALTTTQVPAKENNKKAKKVKKALSYVKKGKYFEAETLCDEAIMIDPKWPNSYLIKGMAQVLTARYAYGENNFKKALELIPADYSDKRRAAFYQDIAATYNVAGFPEESIKYSTEAIRLDPTNANMYMVRGTAYRDTGIIDSAVSDLSKACELNPENKEWKTFLEYQKIVQGLRKPKGKPISGGNVTPNHSKNVEKVKTRNELLIEERATSIANQAVVKGKEGNNSEALILCNQAIKLCPRCEFPYLVRGLTNSEMGRFDLAIPDFKKAIDLFPLGGKHEQLSMFYVYFGRAMGASGKDEEAISVLSKAIELNSSNADAYKHRGVSYYLLGTKEDVSRAVEDFGKARELNPNDKEINDLMKGAVAKSLQNMSPEEKRAVAKDLVNKKYYDLFEKTRPRPFRCGAHKTSQPNLEFLEQNLDPLRYGLITYSLGSNTKMTIWAIPGGMEVQEVILPVSLSSELLNIAKRRGFRTNIKLDLPFIVWFVDALKTSPDPDLTSFALCYFTHLIRTSQFKTIQTFINGYLDSIS